MLAIVIPYFKLTFLEETLISLTNQTNKNFSVYIGNDASLEDPVPLIMKFNTQLRIEYKQFEQNVGGFSLTKQWERCLEMVKNEDWAMLLGDDDFLSINYIQEFYNNLPEIEALGIKVVRFSSKFIIQETGEISPPFRHPKIEKATEAFARKFIESSRGSLSEQIFKLSSYKKHSFRDFPLGWGADNFAWLDFSEFGNIYTINSAIAYIRFSNENISRRGYKMELKDQARFTYFTIIVDKYLGKFESKRRIPILLFYEKMIYNLNKPSFRFWWLMNKTMFSHCRILLALKFNKRFLYKLFQ